MKLRNYIENKEFNGVVEESESVVTACKKMKDQHCGNVIVVKNKGTDREAIGVVTDRDIAIRLIAEGKSPDQTKIKDIMTTDLLILGPETNGGEALKAMKEKGVSRAIVATEDKKFLGVVSANDFLQFVAEEINELASLSESMGRREEKKVAA